MPPFILSLFFYTMIPYFAFSFTERITVWIVQPDIQVLWHGKSCKSRILVTLLLGLLVPSLIKFSTRATSNLCSTDTETRVGHARTQTRQNPKKQDTGTQQAIFYLLLINTIFYQLTQKGIVFNFSTLLSEVEFLHKILSINTIFYQLTQNSNIHIHQKSYWSKFYQLTQN